LPADQRVAGQRRDSVASRTWLLLLEMDPANMPRWIVSPGHAHSAAAAVRLHTLTSAGPPDHRRVSLAVIAETKALRILAVPTVDLAAEVSEKTSRHGESAARRHQHRDA
jgi:hypothetical protein